ncbi:DUF2752 domain-containing protein [Gorillibacterium massiliense]|uniref:DUF2752 domain-containing protein n=1 Tax=Gorillibacterium massiliense TaxID=1280390 RepID=UPI000693D2AA|nr:DUF2752 domain-containing protein [Gorillibacterium massiliense]
MSTNWYKSAAPFRTVNRKLVHGSAFGLGGLLYLQVWLPLTGLAIPCVFLKVTGLYCPGCGMTRAVLSILRLDFYQAFRYNALLFLLLPLFLAYGITQKTGRKRLGSGIMAVMLIMTLGYGLLRNFPAFAWLAPTTI